MIEGERKASAAELLASIVEELRTGSVEAERVRELGEAAAKLLGVYRHHRSWLKGWFGAA
jgi:hypothetical protein